MDIKIQNISSNLLEILFLMFAIIPGSFLIFFQEELGKFIWFFAFFYMGFIFYFTFRFKEEKKPFLLQVEGNIGSGKSTFLKKMKELKTEHIEIIYEPVDQWTSIRDENGKNLLDCFYNDMKRWAYTMQNFAFLTRVRSLLNVSSKAKLRISERSIYTDYHVFAKLAIENGNMNQLEKDIYESWFYDMEKSFKHIVRPDAILYIRTVPKIAFERLKKRGRDEEKNVPLEYLTLISQKHDEMMDTLPYPILTLNGNKEFETNSERMEEIVEILKIYLKKFSWSSKEKRWVFPHGMERICENYEC